MQNEKVAECQETEGKSQNSVEENYHQRFLKQVEAWRKVGCQFQTRDRVTDEVKTCGAPPEKVHQSPANEAGQIFINVDCAKGHKDQFSYMITIDEVKKEGKRLAESESESNAKYQADFESQQDPMIAKMVITMHLATGEIRFLPFIPSPVVGLGMLETAKKQIWDQMMPAKQDTNGLILPEKKLIAPDGTKLQN